MQHQHTLRDVLEFEGVGLHTGAAVRLTLRPQPAGRLRHNWTRASLKRRALNIRERQFHATNVPEFYFFDGLASSANLRYGPAGRPNFSRLSGPIPFDSDRAKRRQKSHDCDRTVGDENGRTRYGQRSPS